MSFEPVCKLDMVVSSLGSILIFLSTERVYDIRTFYIHLADYFMSYYF